VLSPPINRAVKKTINDAKNRGLGVIKTRCSINRPVKKPMKDAKNRDLGVTIITPTLTPHRIKVACHEASSSTSWVTSVRTTNMKRSAAAKDTKNRVVGVIKTRHL